jgi:hypothetical protein
MNDRPAIAACLVLVGSLACSLGASPNTEPDLAATITAQAAAMQTKVGTPAASGTGLATGPELSVSSATECREGPGQEFGLAFTANPGQTYPLTGKNSATQHWIIADPAGGTC